MADRVGSTTGGSVFDELRVELREFARTRQWEQFHTPKNLAMALTAEAGELLEVFQWMSDDDARDRLATATRAAAARELADILIYALRLGDVLDVDLEREIRRKIESNRLRYPIESVRGNAEKRP